MGGILSFRAAQSGQPKLQRKDMTMIRHFCKVPTTWFQPPKRDVGLRGAAGARMVYLCVFPFPLGMRSHYLRRNCCSGQAKAQGLAAGERASPSNPWPVDKLIAVDQLLTRCGQPCPCSSRGTHRTTGSTNIIPLGA